MNLVQNSTNIPECASEVIGENSCKISSLKVSKNPPLALVPFRSFLGLVGTIDVHFLVYRFQRSILLVVQYKYLTSCSKDFIPQYLILRTRSCGTAYIAELSWLLHFHPTTCVWWKLFVPAGVPFPRGISVGPALKYFDMIHRIGRIFEG